MAFLRFDLFPAPIELEGPIAACRRSRELQAAAMVLFYDTVLRIDFSQRAHASTHTNLAWSQKEILRATWVFFLGPLRLRRRGGRHPPLSCERRLARKMNTPLRGSDGVERQP